MTDTVFLSKALGAKSGWKLGIDPSQCILRSVDHSREMHMSRNFFAAVIIALFVFCFPVAAETPGLVAAYAFSESGETITDSSGSGNTGTAQKTTPTTAGMFGSALMFSGTYARVTINDDNSLDLTTGMTIEAWIRPETLSGRRTVLMKERYIGYVYAIYVDDQGYPLAGIRVNDQFYTITGTSRLTSGSWAHLAATFNGSVLRLYVNGFQVASRNVSGALMTTIRPLRVGGNLVEDEWFVGTIDEARVYNRPLTQAEIQADMNTPVSGGPPTGGGGPCDLTGNGIVDEEDANLAVNLSLQATPCSSSICVDGIYNVVAVQRIVNAALGGSCIEGGGTIPHSVILDWTASITPGVVGYNIYRGTIQGGPFSKLNSSLVPGTSYTDGTVQAGQMYYYVATAVDDDGDESTFSNQAVALIPST